jgi:hypothetical protein
MLNSTMMRSFQLAAGAALLAAAGAAHAQWMWVDAKGLKQVSDRPPPASIPAKNILKAPPNAVVEDPVAAPVATGAPQNSIANASQVVAAPKGASWTEREAEFRKRQADKAVADKKLAEASAANDSKTRACQSARDNKAMLDSGIRIRTGAGRSEFMSDKERADNATETSRFLAEYCK